MTGGCPPSCDFLLLCYFGSSAASFYDDFLFLFYKNSAKMTVIPVLVTSLGT